MIFKTREESYDCMYRTYTISTNGIEKSVNINKPYCAFLYTISGGSEINLRTQDGRRARKRPVQHQDSLVPRN